MTCVFWRATHLLQDLPNLFQHKLSLSLTDLTVICSWLSFKNDGALNWNLTRGETHFMKRRIQQSKNWRTNPVVFRSFWQMLTTSVACSLYQWVKIASRYQSDQEVRRSQRYGAQKYIDTRSDPLDSRQCVPCIYLHQSWRWVLAKSTSNTSTDCFVLQIICMDAQNREPAVLIRVTCELRAGSAVCQKQKSVARIWTIVVQEWPAPTSEELLRLDSLIARSSAIPKSVVVQ